MVPDRSDATTVALACQGGGSHSAFCAGTLQTLLVDLPEEYEIIGFSGTSGGALCATTAWYGLLEDGPDGAADRLEALWSDVAARTPLDRAVNEAARWTIALDNGGVPVPDVSPYLSPASEIARRDLRRSIESVVDFDRIPELAAGPSPRLLVSAVDVTGGDARIFADGDVTADALLASAAVPLLFEAVEIDGSPYWDGMFAQNPPVTNFLSGVEDADRKPDEVWVLRVAPERREEVPSSLRAIADRQNELSGNLALEKELAFIDRINEWVAEGRLDGERYKRVAVEQLRLDADLPLSSRFDRSPSFIEDLFERGRATASEFLDSKASE
ncbi:patatin-like phospholipase family protein [Halomicroarcula limicola]|uniref:Patatin-like phospholipase family protein n=1 Tax=Haloarcula limicola TaxID=1429915 RepID=A0A8J7Y307_9EURY|nr:patatin-like phospholipase family protein [Halomicroarcula limicola]MBV0923790.1 patatin-like phospholipase family protein [Halomicroarcula limicola]